MTLTKSIIDTFTLKIELSSIENYTKAMKKALYSTIASRHEGNILAQNGSVIRSKEIKSLRKEVLIHKYKQD